VGRSPGRASVPVTLGGGACGLRAGCVRAACQPGVLWLAMRCGRLDVVRPGWLADQGEWLDRGGRCGAGWSQPPWVGAGSRVGSRPNAVASAAAQGQAAGSRKGSRKVSRKVSRRAGRPDGRRYAAAGCVAAWARLGLGAREFAVQQQALQPAGEVLGMSRRARPRRPRRPRRRCAATGQRGGWPARWPWRHGCGPWRHGCGPWRHGCGPRRGRAGGGAAPAGGCRGRAGR